MWHVISQNKRNHKKWEEEIESKNESENNADLSEATNKDILAMIIAVYQLILPIVLIMGLSITVLIYLFFKFYLK